MDAAAPRVQSESFSACAGGTARPTLPIVHTGLVEIPRSFAAGTQVSYVRSFGEFPASAGWGLVLHLAGPSLLNKAATTSGDRFTVTLLPADTTALSAGFYRWVERVTKGTEKYDAARGNVLVTLDIATATSAQAQSFEERLLPLLEAAITSRSTRDLESYSVDGVSLVKLPWRDLVRIRNGVVAAINARRSGGKAIEDVLARFTGPGMDR